MKIRMLNEIDNVRTRKAVFFGEESPDDICCALEQLLRSFLIEAYAGHTERICLTKHIDGSYSLKSYDFGIDLGEIGDEKPAWEKAFCKLYADWEGEDGPFEYTRDELVNSYIFGYKYFSLGDFAPSRVNASISAVQFASSFMDVEVNRRGKIKRLRFEKGRNILPLSEEISTEMLSYTLLRFSFDSDVFALTEIPNEYIRSLFARYSFLIRGVAFEYTDEGCGEHSIFKWSSAKEYVSYLIGGKNVEVYEAKRVASGSERYDTGKYDSKVKLTVGFSKNMGKTECIHDYRYLKHNGTHFDALTERIMRKINHVFIDLLPKHLPSMEAEIKWEEIAEHIVIVLESYCDFWSTKFKSGTRDSICNRVIADMCEDIISDSFIFDSDFFTDFLRRNYDEIAEIINGIVEKRGGTECQNSCV